MTGAAKAGSALRLEVALPGTWSAFPVAGVIDRADVKRFVDRVVPAGDEHATLRALATQRLTEALDQAGPTGVEHLFFCSEVAPKVPLPVVLAVLAPAELSVSPALSTEPEEVVRVFCQGRAQLYGEGDDDWRIIPTRTGLAVRTADEVHVPLAPEARDVTVPQLSVTYWLTVAGSKRLGVARFSTPVVDIPHVMLELFDAMVGTMRYVGGEGRAC